MQQKSSDKLQNFRVRLKGCADRAGLSQADIATRLGVKTGKVGNWFQGLNYPKADAAKLADILSVPVDFLMRGTGPANKDLAEDQAPYGGTRADRGATLRHPSADDGLASPTHTEPTRESVELLAAKVVAIAARTPGGIGLVHIKLTRCLADLQEIAP